MKRDIFNILLFVAIFCSWDSKGQNIQFDEPVIQELIGLDFLTARKNLLMVDDYILRSSLKVLIQVMENRGQQLKIDSIDISNLSIEQTSERQTIVNNLALGFFTLHNRTDNFDGIQYINTAYILAKENELEVYLKLSLIGIIELYTVQVTHNTDSYKTYIEELSKLAETDSDTAIAKFYENSLNANSIHSPKEFYETSKAIVKISSENSLSPALKGRLYEDIAVYYRVLNNLDSAFYYNRKIMTLPDNNYNRKTKFAALQEMSALSAAANKKDISKKYIKEALFFLNKSDSVKSIYSLERFKALYVHRPLKEYDSAFSLLHKSMIQEANLNFEENKTKINKLNAQLGTAEKDKKILKQNNDLLLTEKEKTQNRNIAIGLGGGLAGVSIIGFLLFKNTKRKQRIAEQQREIEIRKTEKILKEQELTTIDAMISGQEKERQRLAGDLHDSVGATLAAAKLQFHHLYDHKDQLKDLDEMFQNTGDLLDQAYNEVRSMAHLKNSGVIAKKGLLPAVEKLANNASGTNHLKVEVQDFGLNDRLENSMEIAVFRIIQELVTNVIKHAQASEAVISITRHKDTLNIIVEDNGNGFDSSKIQKNDGMGLSSIERRVEHLEGTMEVDSTKGKGTSVLIDIPL